MWEFVTNAIGYFFNALRSFLPGIVGRVLIGLGLGVSTYTLVVPELISWVQSFFNTLDSPTLQLLGYLNVDRAFNLIISATAMKFGMRLNLVRLTSP